MSVKQKVDLKTYPKGRIALTHTPTTWTAHSGTSALPCFPSGLVSLDFLPSTWTRDFLSHILWKSSRRLKGKRAKSLARPVSEGSPMPNLPSSSDVEDVRRAERRREKQVNSSHNQSTAAQLEDFKQKWKKKSVRRPPTPPCPRTKAACLSADTAKTKPDTQTNQRKQLLARRARRRACSSPKLLTRISVFLAEWNPTQYPWPSAYRTRCP